LKQQEELGKIFDLGCFRAKSTKTRIETIAGGQ